MTTWWSRSSTEQKKKEDVGRFKLFLHRGINTVHKFLCKFNTKWLQLDSNPKPLSLKTNTQPFGQTGHFYFFLMIELCSEYLSVWCIWLYHVTYAFQSESPLYSCLNVKELLAWDRSKIWSLSNCNCTRTQNHLVCKRTLNRLAKLAILFFNDWAVFWVPICTVHLTVYSCHVTYTFQSESTLYSCLNVKEFLARSRHEIWILSDCNGIRTHNHLVNSTIYPNWLKLCARTQFVKVCYPGIYGQP